MFLSGKISTVRKFIRGIFQVKEIVFTCIKRIGYSLKDIVWQIFFDFPLDATYPCRGQYGPSAKGRVGCRDGSVESDGRRPGAACLSDVRGKREKR